MSELNILCVDDSEAILSLLNATLPKLLAAGVRVANGSAAALELMSGGEIPDVILIDYMMPGRTGIELAAALKQNPAFEKTCFILHSTVGTSVKRAALNAGVYQVIDKPKRPTELAKAITDTYTGFSAGVASPLIAQTAPAPMLMRRSSPAAGAGESA